MRRQIVVSNEQYELLEQEAYRLRITYGLKVSPPDVMRCLIETHRLRLSQIATHDPYLLPWFYQAMREERDDVVEDCLAGYHAFTLDLVGTPPNSIRRTTQEEARRALRAAIGKRRPKRRRD